MNWLFFALLAPAISTVVNFTDKFLIEKVVPDYRGLPIYATLTGFIVGTTIWIATDYPRLSPSDMLITVGTGMLTIWGTFFYFKALGNESASKIILLKQLQPVQVLLLSWFLLKEPLMMNQLTGFILVLIAVIGITLRKHHVHIWVSPSLLLMAAATFLWALALVLFKLVVETNSFTTLLSYESWGIGLGGSLVYFLFPSVRHSFSETSPRVSLSLLGAIFVNEIIFVIAKLCSFLAISAGPVALVSVLDSSQVFYGIFTGWALSNINPQTFEEDTSLIGISRKLLFGFIGFTGIWLIR